MMTSSMLISDSSRGRYLWANITREFPQNSVFTDEAEPITNHDWDALADADHPWHDDVADGLAAFGFALLRDASDMPHRYFFRTGPQGDLFAIHESTVDAWDAEQD